MKLEIAQKIMPGWIWVALSQQKWAIQGKRNENAIAARIHILVLQNALEPQYKDRILEALSGVDPQPKTNLGATFHELAERVKRRGLILVISDLFGDADEILMGLRHSPALAAQLFRGVVSMRESSTYQAILEEGRTEGRTEGAVAEARKVLRSQGDDAFGPPDARTAAAIDRINDLGRLEDLLKRLRTAGSWKELLGRSTGRGRSG